MFNKHGLSRDIPEDIKRIVRQRCGFGCIFCGCWLYDYEHIIPEWHNATEHNPDNICLLCTNHHRKVLVKRLSKEQVFDQYKHPIALSRGYANEYIELRSLKVVLGTIHFSNIGNLVEIDGQTVLGINPPSQSEPMQINAVFYNNKKEKILQIIDNELRDDTSVWDIEQSGSRTIIRKKHRDIALQLNIVQPNTIHIEKLKMTYGSAEAVLDYHTGRTFLHAMGGGKIDADRAEITTEKLSFENGSIKLDKAMVILATKDIPLRSSSL